MNAKVLATLAATLFNTNPTPGRCYRCQRIIDEQKEFRDMRTLAEYKISHLCQQCQDWVFRQLEEQE